MVSRRRILSRSRDDLQLDEDEEDVWYHRDKLFKDHIQEVLDKWEQIDDEIWAKVIVLERNRRVAKAYARAPVLTINGSDEGFDGFRIGLCGFDNPMRDTKTEEIKRHIGHGVKVKMDEAGNILVKRVSKSNVYVRCSMVGSGPANDESAIGNDVLKLPQGALELDKPVKLFDIKKFQSNVSRELKRAYPDRKRLETQCVCAVAFVRNEAELLDCPCWVMLINIVAMEFLKARLPPVKRGVDIRNRPRIPVPDEDPYSVAGSGSTSSGEKQQRLQTAGAREKPPKLPPRDTNGTSGYPIPKPDYDDGGDTEVPFNKEFVRNATKKSGKDRKYDDPYYCGLRARIPNFAKKPGAPPGAMMVPANHTHLMPVTSQPVRYLHAHPMTWHSRSFDSGMDSDAASSESVYSHLYGRFPAPGQHAVRAPPPPAAARGAPCMYVGEWE